MQIKGKISQNFPLSVNAKYPMTAEAIRKITIKKIEPASILALLLYVYIDYTSNNECKNININIKY
jgi:hypothetical protein